MTDQSDNATTQSALSVISYAPVEEDRSMNRLFRLAMGWYLIVGYGSIFLQNSSQIGYSVFLTGSFNLQAVESLDKLASLAFLIHTFICLGVIFSGCLLLKRKSIAIRMIQIMIWGVMISGTGLIAFQFFASITIGGYFNRPSASFIDKAHHISNYIFGWFRLLIEPTFILFLTRKKIAAIYK